MYVLRLMVLYPVQYYCYRAVVPYVDDSTVVYDANLVDVVRF